MQGVTLTAIVIICLLAAFVFGEAVTFQSTYLLRQHSVILTVGNGCVSGLHLQLVTLIESTGRQKHRNRALECTLFGASVAS